jgi:hypothetical protein
MSACFELSILNVRHRLYWVKKDEIVAIQCLLNSFTTWIGDVGFSPMWQSQNLEGERASLPPCGIRVHNSALYS